jgi:hypothetical protein
VAMIQTADIGVGVMGKEGRQAVNNSDYAVGQFRCVVFVQSLGCTFHVAVNLWVVQFAPGVGVCPCPLQSCCRSCTHYCIDMHQQPGSAAPCHSHLLSCLAV